MERRLLKMVPLKRMPSGVTCNNDDDDGGDDDDGRG